MMPTSQYVNLSCPDRHGTARIEWNQNEEVMQMRNRKSSRRLTALVTALIAAFAMAPAASAACHLPNPAQPYCVGAAVRDISPSSPVYLGGYGFGPVRLSTGIQTPISARALAVSKGDQTVVFAAIDTQGHFLAYQGSPDGSVDGPYGFADIRRRVSEDSGIPKQNIIIQSIHDHAGPDDTGLWGGLSNDYLQFIADQTTAAIEAAIAAEKPAFLYDASIDTAPDHLLANILPSAYPIDTMLRVLVAKDGKGKAIATMVNFSAHPTVLGSGNTLISPDWPGATRNALEQAAPGSIAMVMVGSVGRTQPDTTNTAGSDFAAAKAYGDQIATLALQALSSEKRVDGPISATETALEEISENPLLTDLNLGGTAGVDRILRSILPPYLTAAPATYGTVVGAARIGNVLFSAVPAESYPETELVLEQRVHAQDHFLFGLAEDQLGYDPPTYEVPVVENCSPDDEGLFILNSGFGADVTQDLLLMSQSLGFAVTDTTYTGLSGGPPAPVPCNP